MLYTRNLINDRILRAIEKSKDYLGQGEPASYIPELLNVDVDNFALSLVSTTGEALTYGDKDRKSVV